MNPKPEPKAAEAMAYAIGHHFQRSSVVDFHDLAVTAMERSMGGALPGDSRRKRSGRACCSKADEATTRAVWEQEQQIIGFARAGKGVFAAAGRPGSRRRRQLAGLSDEQKAAVRHVWDSTDQVMLIRGGAGTGKTTMMTPALAKLGAPVVLLAPSADASRGQLAEGRIHRKPIRWRRSSATRRCRRRYAAAASSGSMRPGCCRSTTSTGSVLARDSRSRPASCSRAIPASTRR